MNVLLPHITCARISCSCTVCLIQVIDKEGDPYQELKDRNEKERVTGITPLTTKLTTQMFKSISENTHLMHALKPAFRKV